MKQTNQDIYIHSFDTINFKFRANVLRDRFCIMKRTVRDVELTSDDELVGVITVDKVDLVVTKNCDEWGVDTYATNKLHKSQ